MIYEKIVLRGKGEFDYGGLYVVRNGGLHVFL